MKKFLILQLRPEAEVSDDEFTAILRKGGLTADQTHRIRLDIEDIPSSLNVTDYAGVIVGGGPGCVSDSPAQKTPMEARIEAEVLGLMPQIIEQDHPFMGCCYGIGILAHHLGADVNKSQYGESVGPTICQMTDAGAQDPMLANMPSTFSAFVGHKEAVQHLPDGCVHLLASDPCPFQMIRHGQNVYATQFHPEADADGFETRIKFYKDKGYFDPADAGKLIDMCRASDVVEPEKILRNFVQRYR
ncbi:glutamine amidotransferase [Aestuariibius sp. HNIBRBA575]|uniref:glutamine amidotransferase n=1 Tax=Aestuariibius sp. HNIBRBA575 TaxID=3233343 RepID=UPI0034A525A1